MEDFNDKFKIEEFRLVDLKYWTISLRLEQVTLGSMILSLKRECFDLTCITISESSELVAAFNVIKLLLTKTFNCDKINFLALMMIDSQVHFHVIPRYKEIREFGGVSFYDLEYPLPVNLSDFTRVNKPILISIRDFIKQNI